MTRVLDVPTSASAPGQSCDAQVLVWQDMAGLRGEGNGPKFVKEYAHVGDILRDAATTLRRRSARRRLSRPEHEYH